MDWLWSRRNLQQQVSKRNRGGEGEGVGLGFDKPLDFLATSEERFSARLHTSDLGNSTALLYVLELLSLVLPLFLSKAALPEEELLNCQGSRVIITCMRGTAIANVFPLPVSEAMRA